MSGMPPPPPGSPPYQPGPRTDGAAIAALILAIASFVLCPVLPAVAALFVASAGRRNIAASGGTVQGLNLCQIATVTAWVNIALFVGGALLAAGVLMAS
ncbi:MAG: hypothetical protein QOG43_1649 [Actinomycetota bacterium]|jgi:hypothetical protein|nr:hypothetical protein [Actinomycetota bacterium]